MINKLHRQIYKRFHQFGAHLQFYVPVTTTLIISVGYHHGTKSLDFLVEKFVLHLHIEFKDKGKGRLVARTYI